MKVAPPLTRDLEAMVAHHEGLRLEPYVCPAGLLTTGVGHVITKSDRAAGLHTRRLTKQEALALLREDLRVRGPQLARLIDHATAAQFSALLSFLFNVGSGNFQNSTLRRRHNQGKFDLAAAEFHKWRRGGGRILAGLVARRKDEAAMYLRESDGAAAPAHCAVCGK